MVVMDGKGSDGYNCDSYSGRVARDLMAVMDGKGSDGYNCDSYRQTVDLQILQKRMPACNANNQ